MAECHKCGYEWGYTGGLMRATCPNCGGKVPIDKNSEKADGSQ